MKLLNILLLNSISFIGGAERWAITLGKKLKERGHRVVIVGRSGSKLIQESTLEGLETFSINMSNDVDPISIRQLVKVIRKHGVHVVATSAERDFKLGGIAAKIVGLGGVIARLRSVWSPNRTHWGSGLKFHKQRFNYNHLALKVVTNSQAGKEDLVEGGWLPEEKVEVIYNGVDLKFFDPEAASEGIRKEFSISPESPLVVMVGRLAKQKGQLRVLQAAEKVLSRFPSAEFMFVGTATNKEYFAELREYYSHFGRKDSVIFTGYRRDVRDILAEADMLVLPSTEEGLPNAALEAMAMKLPVVATNVCGTKEAIRDGVNGFLIPPNNPEILSQAIMALIENKTKRKSMGEWGRKIVEEKFELGRMVTHYEQLFRNYVRNVHVG